MTTPTPAAATTFLHTLPLPPNTLTTLLPHPPTPDYLSLTIHLLTALFPTHAHLPSTPAYTASLDLTWSTRARLPALLILTPPSASILSLALRILTFFSAPFAVRSGGHTPSPNLSSTSSILLSLELLTTLTLSADHALISVGPGNRWSSVYDALAPHNLTVIGGRVPTVGVAGLITGGGISHLSTAFGFAADQVAAFEVVLSTGEIVEATATTHSDLFKALKGGSGNFGIVTRFDLYTVPTPGGVWGGVQIFTPAQYPTLTTAFAAHQTTHQISSPRAGLVATQIFCSGGKDQMWMNMVMDPDSDSPPAMQQWSEIGPVHDTTQRYAGGMGDLITEAYYNFGTPAVQRQDFRTQTIGISAALHLEIATLFTETYTPLASIPGLMAVMAYQPIAVSTLEVSTQKGGNVMGIQPVAQTWLCHCLAWDNADDDEKVLGAGKELMAGIRALAEKRGLAMEFLYLNYAAADQRVVESYGEENIEFLRAVSGRYDPEGVFQRLVGGFKL